MAALKGKPTDDTSSASAQNAAHNHQNHEDTLAQENNSMQSSTESFVLNEYQQIQLEESDPKLLSPKKGNYHLPRPQGEELLTRESNVSAKGKESTPTEDEDDDYEKVPGNNHATKEVERDGAKTVVCLEGHEEEDYVEIFTIKDFPEGQLYKLYYYYPCTPYQSIIKTSLLIPFQIPRARILPAAAPDGELLSHPSIIPLSSPFFSTLLASTASSPSTTETRATYVSLLTTTRNGYCDEIWKLLACLLSSFLSFPFTTILTYMPALLCSAQNESTKRVVFLLKER